MQDLTTERLKLEDAKASFAQQLKSIDGGSKDALDRACKAEAQVTELKMQMQMVKEAAAASLADKDDAAALKMMKIQLQKSEMDKRSLAQQVYITYQCISRISEPCHTKVSCMSVFRWNRS